MYEVDAYIPVPVSDLNKYIVEEEFPERWLWNPQISSVVYPWTREDLLNFLSFYTLVIFHVFFSRSNKCTSKVVTPDNKQTMAENTASWSETAQKLDEDNSSLNFFSTNSLFL